MALLLKVTVKVMLVAYDELIESREHEITADNQLEQLTYSLATNRIKGVPNISARAPVPPPSQGLGNLKIEIGKLERRCKKKDRGKN
jgi:hypothetical protein